MAKRYKGKPSRDQSPDARKTNNDHGQDFQCLEDENHVAAKDAAVEQSAPAHQAPPFTAQNQSFITQQSASNQRAVSDPQPDRPTPFPATQNPSSTNQPNTTDQRNTSDPLQLHRYFKQFKPSNQAREPAFKRVDEAGNTASYYQSQNNSTPAGPLPTPLDELRTSVSSMEHVRRRSESSQVDTASANPAEHGSQRGADTASIRSADTTFRRITVLLSAATAQIIGAVGQGVVANRSDGSVVDGDGMGTELDEGLEALRRSLATDIEAVRRDLRIVTILLVVTVVVIGIMLAALICFRR